MEVLNEKIVQKVDARVIEAMKAVCTQLFCWSEIIVPDIQRKYPLIGSQYIEISTHRRLAVFIRGEYDERGTKKLQDITSEEKEELLSRAKEVNGIPVFAKIHVGLSGTIGDARGTHNVKMLNLETGQEIKVTFHGTFMSRAELSRAQLRFH